MKTYFLAPALLAAGAAQAQTNTLKVDVFQPIISTLALSFEHKLGATGSFQVTLGSTINYKEIGYTLLTNQAFSPNTSGFSIMPEYRYYLSERHPTLEGFYAAPFLRYQHLEQTGLYYDSSGYSQAYEAKLNSFGLGLIVGWQWIFKKHFSLDTFVGPNYTFAGVSSDQAAFTPTKSNFVGYHDGKYYLRGGVTLGLAF